MEVTDEMVEAGSRAAYGDHFERYRGLIRRALDAALVKAERERAWQPIETAPKDGTQFLGIIEGGSGPCQVIVNWHPFGYWDCGLPCQILGWQPLQPLPSNEQVR